LKKGNKCRVGLICYQKCWLVCNLYSKFLTPINWGESPVSLPCLIQSMRI